LDAGSARAADRAEQTMQDVRVAMGLSERLVGEVTR
jgi:hypothetical protein